MTASLRHADLKARQRRLRDGFPMPLTLRVHRALSWLGRAEAADGAGDEDVRFILLWIGFNAAYAGDAARATGEGERDAFRGYFETLLGIDAGRRIYATVWQRFPARDPRAAGQPLRVRAVLGASQRRAGQRRLARAAERSRARIGQALARQDTATILSILFDRLYVLRNQLVHGGATWASEVNRAQVRDGAALLGCLLPAAAVHRPDDGRPRV